MARLPHLLVGLFLFSAAAHAAGPAETLTMFNWLPTESAPARYPMRMIDARLQLPDGRSVQVPSNRNVSNGWGAQGAIEIRGPAEKPVPARLDITWYSYTEGKFFRGEFPLPQQQMAALFAGGIREDRRTGKPAAFERIIVGTAPDGLAAVWMAAASEVVEVAAFQASEVQLPWSTVVANPNVGAGEYTQALLEERLGRDGVAQLRKEGVPRGRFQAYRSQFRWKPWVTGAGTPLAIQIRSFNGENAYVGPNGAAIARENRPVPAEIDLDWQTSDGVRVAKIVFDEQEVFAAFQKLARGDASRQLALQLETSRTGVSVSLRDEQFVLPFEKARVQILRRQ